MFLEQWGPNDLILTSRQIVRDTAQKLLFQRHKERYQDIAVPLLYKPRDTRKQNVLVTIPGSNHQETLVSNDIVNESIEVAEQVLTNQIDDWCLGYVLTVHSSQGLTFQDPQKFGSSIIVYSGRILSI